MTSSGASVAERVARSIASVRVAFSVSEPFGNRNAAMTSRYASLSRSTRSRSPSRSGCSRDDASARSAVSSGAPVFVFGRPATIRRSDTPTVPASAAADPPPGTASVDEKASIRSASAISAKRGGSGFMEYDLAAFDDHLNGRCVHANQFGQAALEHDRVHQLAGLEA